MAFFKRILATLLCLLFIPCTVTSDNDVDQRRIDLDQLLRRPKAEIVETMESMGLIVPQTYYGENGETDVLEYSVWETLNWMHLGHYALPNPSSTSYVQLSHRLYKIAVERDPEVAAGWRQYYASVGMPLPKIYDEGDAVVVWIPVSDVDYIVMEYHLNEGFPRK